MSGLVKNLILAAVVVGCFFAFVIASAAALEEAVDIPVLVSDNHYSPTDVYIEKCKRKIKEVAEKICNGTATEKDYHILEYYKARIQEAQDSAHFPGVDSES